MKYKALITFALLANTANAYTDKQEIGCLANNVYFEARGEEVPEQIAVAHATLNRVQSPDYPNTVCGVVWQASQYSWTMDEKLHFINDLNAWERAYKIATHVYNGVIDYDETRGATHYWAHKKISRPYWAHDPKQEIKLAAHTYIIPD